jgi:hypothetical protein
MLEFLLHLIGGALDLITYPRERRRLKALRKKNWQQFYSTSVPAGVSGAGFEGKSAKIIKQDDSSSVLEIHARNGQGEYYFFVSGADRACIKAITPDMAKIALGKDYIT